MVGPDLPRQKGQVRASSKTWYVLGRDAARSTTEGRVPSMESRCIVTANLSLVPVWLKAAGVVPMLLASREMASRDSRLTFFSTNRV